MHITEDFVEPEPHEVNIVWPADLGESESEPFFTVIWFDPGLTTGWSVIGVWPEAMKDPSLSILSNIAAWSAGEFNGTENSMTDDMMCLVDAWYDRTQIGYEDFVLQKFTMARDLLAPVRVAARFEYAMHSASRTAQIVTPQSASLAMRTVTDERLKAWGFWTPLRGKPHARDAVRHNITWLRRVKDRNVKGESS